MFKWVIVYTHIYINIKKFNHIKKSSAFANLLMDKPGNSFAVIKM